MAQAADVLILAVKPQFFPEVIAEIKGAVREETLIISIAPGKTMEWIMEHFGRELKLVRCMPNTPALVGEGCTGFCCYKLVSEEEQAQAAAILGSFGRAYQVPENLFRHRGRHQRKFSGICLYADRGDGRRSSCRGNAKSVGIRICSTGSLRKC